MNNPITNTNPFATAEAFADFPNPWNTCCELRSHRGCWVNTMQVCGVKRVYNYDGGEFAHGHPFAWVRESCANASTENRTVDLSCYDIAIPEGLSANSVVAYAEAVFSSICKRTYHGAFRAADQAKWMLEHAEWVWMLEDGFVRVCCVEDLS